MKVREPREITAYVHAAPVPAPTAQVPDTQPGDYYVSCHDKHAPNAGYHLLLGPFVDDHAKSLSYVSSAQACCLANDRGGKAVWMAYGTVCFPHGYKPATPTVLVVDENGAVLPRREAEQKLHQAGGQHEDPKD